MGEYILLAALLHVFVALKRTWDISINYTVASGKLNLAISGITLLTFMVIHLFQFRFGATQPFKLCPPPYLVNLGTLMHLPTTNGEHCTGDGIKMGEAIGGKSIDLEWVQVHPTGLVKPDDPDAKIKFLAAEAL